MAPSGGTGQSNSVRPTGCHRLGRSPIATSAQPMNPTTHLAIVTEYDGQRSVLRLQGELDASNRDQLHSTISSALRSHPPLLVVDLSGLGFMDCAGLSVLVWARKRLAGCGHQLVITGAEPVVQRLLHLTGLDIYLCLSNTDEDIYT
jgi:anti-sigma B factor antagonist